jgi:Fe-S cluster assembly iron-binding protein IscA
MFEVTQEASRVVKDFLAKQKSKQAIRILLQTG